MKYSTMCFAEETRERSPGAASRVETGFHRRRSLRERGFGHESGVPVHLWTRPQAQPDQIDNRGARGALKGSFCRKHAQPAHRTPLPSGGPP